MGKCAVYKVEKYDDTALYDAVSRHFEAHDIKSKIPAGAKVLLKPNLVVDKDAAFSVTTNPRFVYAVIRYLKNIGVEDITVADCPGGALLLFSEMETVYRKTGYSFLSEFAKLNTDFESKDINSPEDSVNKDFNIINAVSEADFIINIPKLKTHNMTCITAGVKNLFGCIPGLQKPAFHAKYPAVNDFSNMLVELAQTVKPDFTIVDAIDIMEGDGPTNGKKRHLGLTFSSCDVFSMDAYIVNLLGIPEDFVATVSASRKKNLVQEDMEIIGDADFSLEKPILLPSGFNATSGFGKLTAKLKTTAEKLISSVFMSYPQMNEKCVLCKKCVVTCPKNALSIENKKIVLNKKVCIGCLCCDEVCPNAAVDIRKKIKTQR
ncbi:MAG: DUF362 domain-containing protein [Acutalibacteraceae bacterium]|nr:DUF362 domain-containing protein [Acutalibacteraceae bacterium]